MEYVIIPWSMLEGGFGIGLLITETRGDGETVIKNYIIILLPLSH
jgi:hypothetical protein